MEIDMTFNFFALTEYAPCLTFTATGEGLWDAMCEAIADHVLGVDPWSETPARDIIEIVEMQTTDESEYVEAVYVQGKLMGSLGTPFFLDPSEYFKI
jgi:hypothetical protein